jgi:hypothetical protein
MAEFKYTPLTASEQDAVQRMQEDQELMVEVEDWGYHPNPDISVGDKRIKVKFPMVFERPEGISLPVRHFDLKLKLRNGRVLVETRESTLHNGKPLSVTAGTQVALEWDLMIDEIPEDVRDLVIPNVQGDRVASIENGEVVKHMEGNDDSEENETSSEETE